MSGFRTLSLDIPYILIHFIPRRDWIFHPTDLRKEEVVELLLEDGEPELIKRA